MFQTGIELAIGNNYMQYQRYYDTFGLLTSFRTLM